ncbi:hypothetical protein NLI96_g1023 [Meripilus lineatus]|uniref:F-box domain-containing protein n=1 Tax=Meripilus lineatus TaxID=2056292 RepID=A0AAD5YN79_9APHY|nr:hypothetical protein NLI96_g1023 [Physisporinus lineatus]
MCWTADQLTYGWRLDPTSHTARWCWVTQVCQLWRDVAIRCKTLWTYIVLPRRSLDYLLTFLSRSSDLPIHLCVRGDMTSLRMSLLETALSVLPRLASIDIYLPSSVTPARGADALIINQLFNRDAPLLTSFTVAFGGETQPLAKAWPLQGDLDLSSLRTLELFGQSFAVMRNYLRPTLTSLKLAWSDGTQAPPATDLLQPLSYMDQLEWLEITPIWGDYPAPVPRAPRERAPCIVLPRLQYFELTTNYFDCKTLLSSITFPSKSQTAFFIYLFEYNWDLDHGPNSFLATFRNTLQNITAHHAPNSALDRPILSAQLQFSHRLGHLGSSISAWDHLGKGRSPSGSILPQGRPTVFLSMDDLDGRNAYRALRRFYITLPLSSLVQLEIKEAQRRCPTAHWRRLVRALPALEYLQVVGSGPALVCVLRAISGDPQEGNGDHFRNKRGVKPSTFLLPRLTRLSIGPGERRYGLVNARNEFIKILASILQTRFQAAQPIQELQILWGYPTDKDRLKESLRSWVNALSFLWYLPYRDVDLDDSSDEWSAEDSESDKYDVM